MKPLVLFLVGPTATGKSQIAIQLAKRLKGEIISADSMLIYKGMNIGTAKPSRADQKKIPHHFVDLLPPSRNFSVFQYYEKAIQKIKEITGRKKIPIVVGGTGLYVRALLKGFTPQPGTNPKLRRELSQKAKTEGGLATLYAQLQKINPERALKIKSTDERRIVRALEIAALSALKPISARGPKEVSLKELGYEPKVIGITQNRGTLYEAIERRVDQMFKKGLLSEVKKLKKAKLSRTAAQAVGYKEVLAALKGEYSMERAQELVKRNTRHLAKRQWTWFRREEGIEWLEKSDDFPLPAIVDKIAKEIEADLKSKSI